MEVDRLTLPCMSDTCCPRIPSSGLVAPLASWPRLLAGGLSAVFPPFLRFRYKSCSF